MYVCMYIHICVCISMYIRLSIKSQCFLLFLRVSSRPWLLPPSPPPAFLATATWASPAQPAAAAKGVCPAHVAWQRPTPPQAPFGERRCFATGPYLMRWDVAQKKRPLILKKPLWDGILDQQQKLVGSNQRSNLFGAEVGLSPHGASQLWT